MHRLRRCYVEHHPTEQHMSNILEARTIVTATLKFPAGRAADAERLLLPLLDKFRGHEGYIAYELARDSGNPDILRVGCSRGRFTESRSAVRRVPACRD